MAKTDIEDLGSGIVLIYFDGCPHIDEARLELKALCVEFKEICQNRLEQGDPLLNYSSPTIISNGLVVLGAEVCGAASCTHRNAIDYDQVRIKLSKHSSNAR